VKKLIALLICLPVLLISLAVYFTLQTSKREVAKKQQEQEQEGSLRLPNELALSQLEDKAGVIVPFDVVVTDQDGKTFKLGQYFNDPSDTRPVIMTLGYYGCPMLCTLVLGGLLEALRHTSFKIGSDFRVISMSIDEREQPDLAKAKQKNYMQALGISNPEYWKFHVMSAGEAQKLADAVGFNYYYDKKEDQFAHGAGFFVLTPTGKLARTLFGISYAPTDIKLALSEAAEGKIGSFIEQVLLSCFHYNPDSQRYGVYILGVMRLGGVLTMLLLGGVLLMYFRFERKRSVV
jgi:protein SCO1/2